MNHPTPKTKTTNNQTVRLPMDLYVNIADLALREDTTMNTMIIRLLNLGLGYQTDFEKAVRDFVFRTVSKEELDILIHGKAPVIHT
jgi:hypothetical protein